MTSAVKACSTRPPSSFTEKPASSAASVTTVNDLRAATWAARVFASFSPATISPLTAKSFGVFMLAVLTVSFLAVGQWAFRYADAKDRAEKAAAQAAEVCWEVR